MFDEATAATCTHRGGVAGLAPPVLELFSRLARDCTCTLVGPYARPGPRTLSNRSYTFAPDGKPRLQDKCE